MGKIIRFFVLYVLFGPITIPIYLAKYIFNKG